MPTAAVIGTIVLAATTVIIIVEKRFRTVKELIGNLVKIERAQLKILADEAGPNPTGPNPVLHVVK